MVYNHTAEGNQMGPTLSFRGIDNASTTACRRRIRATTWISPAAATRSTCMNPRVLQLIMDSLRYWVRHMHVDGFRFDLASTLARELHEVNKLGAFFDIIHQDPVISQVKLIAEPWDLGEGGYQVGNFPRLVVGMERQVPRLHPPLLERRRRHGLGVRHALLRLQRPLRMEQPPAARQHQLRHLPRRLHAQRPGVATTRSTTRPTARRTATANRTTSVGTAAPKARPTTRRSTQLREKKKRSFLATLLFSQGVPMLLAGDEIGHTQQGNNNAYCQDNEIVLARLGSGRRSTGALGIHPPHDPTSSTSSRSFTAAGSFTARRSRAPSAGDRLARSDGKGDVGRGLEGSRSCAAWACSLFGRNIDVDEHGEPIDGDTMLLLFNADHANTIDFILPPADDGQPWELLIDTAKSGLVESKPVEDRFQLAPCSMAVFSAQTSLKAAKAS